MRFILTLLFSPMAFATTIPCDMLCAQNLLSSLQKPRSYQKLTHNPFLDTTPQTRSHTKTPHYLKLEAIMNAKALIDGTWYKSGKTPFGTILSIHNDHIMLMQGKNTHTIKVSQHILWYR